MQSSSLRLSLSTWGTLQKYKQYSVQCTALYRVREFLSYVVPSNTLSSEEFRLRCIDVMAGSVRRTDEAS